MKTLIIKCPSKANSTDLKKLDNYVGIEFVRHSSNGGGENGYYRMIGNEELIQTLPLFDEIKACTVKNGRIVNILNQTDWTKNADGTISITDGSDGSDVMICYPHMYAILGGSNETYERWIFSDSEFSYDGDEAEEIDAFAECPDYEMIIDGKARSVWNGNYGNKYNTMSPIKDVTNDYYAAAGFPTVNTSRYGFQAAAHAKNSNNASNFPYCNGNVIDARVIIGMLYVECRTKNINSVFGHGVSCNVGISEETFNNKTVSGVKNVTDGTYLNLNTQVWIKNGDYTVAAPIYTTLTNTISGWYSALKVMDSQMSVSRKDTNSTYATVKNSNGDAIKGLADGVMTGTVCKEISFKLNCAVTADGEMAERQFTIHLCVPVWRGRSNLYGNIWSWLSGGDVVEYQVDGVFHHDLYEAPNIAAITREGNMLETTSSDDYLTEFGLADYKYYGDLGNVGGWMTENYSVDGKTSIVSHHNNVGGAINTYECAYTYMQNAAAEGTFIKRGSLLGGAAYNSYCVARFVFVNNGPSHSFTYIGSRFRCALA